MLIGCIVSVLLCFATQEYITFGISIVVGLLSGIFGIGYKQDTLIKAQKEKGVRFVGLLFAIFVANMFMVIALSCSGQQVFSWS